MPFRPWLRPASTSGKRRSRDWLNFRFVDHSVFRVILSCYIDIFEVMPGHSMPFTGPVDAFMSSSLQISPGIEKSNPRRPKNGLKLNSSQIWYFIFMLFYHHDLIQTLSGTMM